MRVTAIFHFKSEAKKKRGEQVFLLLWKSREGLVWKRKWIELHLLLYWKEKSDRGRNNGQYLAKITQEKKAPWGHMICLFLSNKF